MNRRFKIKHIFVFLILIEIKTIHGTAIMNQKVSEKVNTLKFYYENYNNSLMALYGFFGDVQRVHKEDIKRCIKPDEIIQLQRYKSSEILLFFSNISRVLLRSSRIPTQLRADLNFFLGPFMTILELCAILIKIWKFFFWFGIVNFIALMLVRYY